MTVRITVTSVLVDDQDRALAFYTEKLGFAAKRDTPAGGARWLTVVSPAEPDGTELLLEPISLPAAATYQKALYDAGIPLTAFAVDDIEAEYARLRGLGVSFRSPPQKAGDGPTTAVLENTCGNLILIYDAREVES